VHFTRSSLRNKPFKFPICKTRISFANFEEKIERHEILSSLCCRDAPMLGYGLLVPQIDDLRFEFSDKFSDVAAGGNVGIVIEVVELIAGEFLIEIGTTFINVRDIGIEVGQIFNIIEGYEFEYDCGQDLLPVIPFNFRAANAEISISLHPVFTGFFQWCKKGRGFHGRDRFWTLLPTRCHNEK